MAQILIVEPDLGLRNWCRMHLVTAGHEVTAVDDARRALKVSNDRPPDLIIIDTELANAGAFALAANLRAATRTADIPIIFAVPADDAAAIAQASAIAPGRVLTKPFARTALVETVTTRLTEGSPAAADRAPAGTAAASQDAPARPALRQQLSMETKTASVLVVTLRNLVSMARSLRMKSLDPLLQRFLGEARDAINAQGGWVVRIDATGLIALFENSPHEARSHASLAIESALNIVVAARRVKRWGEAALDEPFTPDLSVGCGVHSGEVIVARLAFGGLLLPSIAGQTVDIASRFNGRAKGLGWSVAVSEASAHLSGSRFEFGRRSTLTDTDHDVTIPIIETLGIAPGAAMPGELALMAEIREALLANTVIARLAGDVDPQTADRTVLISADKLAAMMLPTIPDRRVDRRLGQGPHVTTYRAVHAFTNRDEAVRTVPLSQVGPEFADRYLDEYRRLSDIDRPTVLRIHEIGRAGDEYAYVATEWLGGTTLSEIIRKRLSIGAALDLLAQMAGALQAVHAVGLHHGALNVDHFLFRDGHTIVLADFNTSRRIADGAADQADGVRADLRALGFMLLAMLAQDTARMEAALQGTLHDVPEATELPIQLASLQPLLGRLLGFDDHSGFDSASQVLAELDAVKSLWGRPTFQDNTMKR